MDAISFLWTEVVTRPLTNGLVFLYVLLGNNFWLAIIVFTVLSRLVLWPLTVKQLRSTKALQELQPRVKALQEKFKDDKQRLNREMMRVYKEAGVNPIGCLGPLILQLPIFIGLFAALRAALADTPEGLVSLSGKLYSWLPFVNEAIPLNSKFLWLNLGRADPTPVLPVLVGLSTWVTQKMTQVPNADPSQAGVNRITSWLLPFMFGIWAFAFPSGLSIYWIVSNFVGAVMQYRVMGLGGLAKQPVPAPAATATAARPARTEKAERALPSGEGPPAPAAPGKPEPGPGLAGLLKRIFLGSPPARKPAPSSADAKAEDKGAGQAVDKGESRGTSGDDGEDRGGSGRKGPEAARPRARRRRSRRRR